MLLFRLKCLFQVTWYKDVADGIRTAEHGEVIHPLSRRRYSMRITGPSTSSVDADCRSASDKEARKCPSSWMTVGQPSAEVSAKWTRVEVWYESASQRKVARHSLGGGERTIRADF